jgi:hypothetical protein
VIVVEEKREIHSHIDYIKNQEQKNSLSHSSENFLAKTIRDGREHS